MTLNQIRYALAVFAREVPAGYCEQTAEWEVIRLVSLITRAYRRRAAEIVRHDAGERMYRELARLDRAAADRAAERRREWNRETLTVRADRAAERAVAAAERAERAAAELRRAERAERAAGLRAAADRASSRRFSFAPDEFTPFTPFADAAERAAAERAELARHERAERAAAELARRAAERAAELARSA